MPLKMKNFKFMFLFTLLLLTSCSKDDEEKMEDAGGIGLISEEEFNAVLPPTYIQFNETYEKVVKSDKALLHDTSKLSRAIFDEIADANTSSEAPKSDDTDVFFDLSSSMTKAEWRLVLTSPLEAFNGIPSIQVSYDHAVMFYPCDEDVAFIGAKASALKHALWSALMLKNTNEEFAEKMSAARETLTKDKDLKAMNLHNNAFGIQLGSKFPEASEEQLLVLLLEQNYTMVKNGSNITDKLDALVFLKGKRQFDMVMEGSLSNPDSGAPWDIKINFSHCWNTVRGRFVMVRGEAL
ncbi:hypothetical protein RQM65_09890 [Pricia sp. S334]|uniref:DUF6973 domain-containing protein n=1 Tax=Pricia mediterranea TaxID=3076079 RepID=A0ABU3L7D3_9FLAO|nr:hypothetical protein [Pricia sp. S334]MDT7828972.1 hypothetical protein [Pricia sp. S334]